MVPARPSWVIEISRAVYIPHISPMSFSDKMAFSTPPWKSMPETLTLGPDEVHVWRVSLNMSAPELERLAKLLHPEEQGRAERFHYKKDHDRFIAARGMLRTLLGLYLNVRPEQLSFCYSKYGKPELADVSAGDRLRFNLSHSKLLALYAFTYKRDLGIDIEFIRPDFDSIGIAGRFFSPREASTIRALPPNIQQEAFFACWTCKEAFIKAKGKGLSYGLNQFDVTVAPEGPAKLLSINGSTEEASRWSLYGLAPGPGFAAALAVEENGLKPKCQVCYYSFPNLKLLLLK